VRILRLIGCEILGSSPAEMAQLIAGNTSKFAKIVKEGRFEIEQARNPYSRSGSSGLLPLTITWGEFGIQTFAGLCDFSQSSSALFIRVCHPEPLARKAAITSGLYLMATCSLVGERFGPRVLALPSSTPPCRSTAPSQSGAVVAGLSTS
jgi:hypothetical protein